MATQAARAKRATPFVGSTRCTRNANRTCTSLNAGRNQFMVFAENLLENAGGGTPTPLPVFSRGGSLLPPSCTDGRSPDDVIAF